MKFNYEKPRTPADYIGCSLTMHPTLFVEALQARAKHYRQYAATAPLEDTRKSSAWLAKGCTAAAERIDVMNYDEAESALADIMADSLLWVPAFSEASRLNCVGHLHKDIVRDYPAGTGEHNTA